MAEASYCVYCGFATEDVHAHQIEPAEAIESSQGLPEIVVGGVYIGGVLRIASDPPAPADEQWYLACIAPGYPETAAAYCPYRGPDFDRAKEIVERFRDEIAIRLRQGGPPCFGGVPPTDPAIWADYGG